MRSRPPFLKLCEQLMQAGLQVDLSPGSRVGRGFADLGYEEFLILPPRRLLSLFTGQVSELNPEHERFFFSIPTPDQLVAELDSRCVDIVRLVFEHQRAWVLEFRKSEENSQVVQASQIEDVLGLALLKGLLKNSSYCGQG